MQTNRERGMQEGDVALANERKRLNLEGAEKSASIERGGRTREAGGRKRVKELIDKSLTTRQSYSHIDFIVLFCHLFVHRCNITWFLCCILYVKNTVYLKKSLSSTYG